MKFPAVKQTKGLIVLTASCLWQPSTLNRPPPKGRLGTEFLCYLQLANFCPMILNFSGCSWHLLPVPHRSGQASNTALGFWPGQIFTAYWFQQSHASQHNPKPWCCLRDGKMIEVCTELPFSSSLFLLSSEPPPLILQFYHKPGLGNFVAVLVKVWQCTTPLSLLPLTKRRSCNYSRYERFFLPHIPWEGFLLEGYIQNFSIEFHLFCLHDRFSLDKDPVTPVTCL